MCGDGVDARELEGDVSIENVEFDEHNDDNLGNETEETRVIDKIDEPSEGMKFESIDELTGFYSNYARQIGFAVSVRTSGKVDGVQTYVTLACTRSGKVRVRSTNPVNMRPQTKTNCPARVRAMLRVDNKWIMSIVKLEHNHEMSPSKSRYYKSNRVLEPHVKRRLELNDKAGIRMNKNFNSFVVEAGGHENVPFLEKDCRNYINEARRLQLQDGDANAMQNYFLKMQVDNSEFFYMIDLNKDGQLKNVFWADARSRAAYKEFGDVVTFDTTYLVNKYDMPFAPFVGVNHHGQSILLGCGLVSSEDTETFIWLFQSWLTCMSNNPPNGIITDQDKAMKKAIGIVFPNSRHRWCLWHIMKKVPEKLKGYNEYESIKFSLQNVVYNSLTKEEFEDLWEKFIEKYKLHNNQWLIGLYEERYRWVPAYVKDMFWAGMSTTQRSESMNSFFDGYINGKTTLKQFVEQYENALAKKVENENHEEFNSSTSSFPCITQYELEKQFQSIYTRSKFKELQRELVGKICCHLISSKKNIELSEYEIREDVATRDGHRSAIFKLRFNEKSEEVDCNCRLFEFKGIPCRHQIMVYTSREIFLVPQKYVFKRWSRMVKRSHTKVRIIYDKWYDKPETRRFDKMNVLFYEVANMACGNEDLAESVMKQLLQMKDVLEEKIKICENNKYMKNGSNSERDAISISKNDANILDPLDVRRKGRRPEKRKQGTVEKVVRKKKVKKNARSSTIRKDNTQLLSEHSTPPQTGLGTFGTTGSFNLNDSQIHSHYVGGQHPNMLGRAPFQENLMGQRFEEHPFFTRDSNMQSLHGVSSSGAQTQ